MASEATARASTWRRIYPFEIAAVVVVASAVIFLRAQGLRIDWHTVGYTIPPMLPITGKALLAGIPLVLLYRALSRQSLRGYLREVASFSWLQLWARLWISYMAITYAYFWLKVSVPLVHWRVFDPEAWRLDTLLHLGVSPSVFMVNLLAGTPLLGWLDVWYGLWLKTVFYSIAFFSAFPDPVLRRRLMMSSALIWGLGAWIYTAFPVLGPIYAHREQWAVVQGQMPIAEGTQAMLAENYARVVAGRDGTLRAFNPTRGVAAMPSLHVGVLWLLMLFARRYARPLFLPFALATAATFVGALATGWHYAIDIYVGIALAQFCYWLACRLEVEPEAEDAGTVVAAGGSAPPSSL